MKISFIRHWDARYDNVLHDKDFQTVGDLKIDAIEKLRSQAQIFADKLISSELVTIWSSPIPRAVETANIFTEELNKREVAIRKRKLFSIFEEARGFKWEYLRGMVMGGEVKVNSELLVLDKTITNPKWLSFGQYFRQSAWKLIPSDYISHLGKSGDVLSNIETFASITNRIFRELERLSKANIDKKNHILIFTHQCNTDFLTELLNEYQFWGIGTGENITLQHRDLEFDIIDFPQNIVNIENTNGIISATKDKFSDILPSAP